MRKFYESPIEEEEQEKRQKLFVYPDCEQGLGVFGYEDLGVVSLVVSEEGGSLNVFVCKDHNFSREF